MFSYGEKLEKMKTVKEPGPVPHCPNWVSHEAVRIALGTTKEEASM